MGKDVEGLQQALKLLAADNDRLLDAVFSNGEPVKLFVYIFYDGGKALFRLGKWNCLGDVSPSMSNTDYNCSLFRKNKTRHFRPGHYLR